MERKKFIPIRFQETELKDDRFRFVLVPFPLLSIEAKKKKRIVAALLANSSLLVVSEPGAGKANCKGGIFGARW